MSPDKRTINQLNDLRKKAEKALAQSDGKDWTLELLDNENLDASNGPRILEELRVYQAELEIQNLQLRESELQAQQESQRYVTLFDSMPVAVLVVDHAGVVIEANLCAAELFSFRGPQRLLKHSLFRLFDAESSLWLVEHLSHLAKKQTTQVQAKLHIAQTPDAIPVEGSLVKLPSSYALDDFYLLILRDMREQIQLDHYHRLLQALLDNSDTLIYAFDKNAKCLLANHQVAKLLGCRAEEMIGQQRGDLISTAELKRHEKNDQQVLITRKSLVFEETFEDSKGQQYNFLSNKFPLLDENGQAFAVGGITTDITNLKHIETQLNLALQVFSQGSEGILIANEKCQITYVNHAFEKITGFSKNDVLGKRPNVLASGRHKKEFWDHFWLSLCNDGHWMGEVWNRRCNGEVYPQWISVSRVETDPVTETQYIGVFRDITQQKHDEETIERLAFYDELTGCANRYLLRDRVRQKVAEMQRENSSFCLIFLDLDHFKDVNDVHGHSVGDLLLQQVVLRINDQIRECDTLSRIGGDEFVILLSDVHRENIKQKAKQLIEIIVSTYFINETEINISASIGIACYPEHGHDCDTLLKHADIAMYAAKEAGRNTFIYFESYMVDQATLRLNYDTAMRQSLLQGHFSLAYQPQYELVSQNIIGVEALLRWSHPEIGVISPDIFIPIAEQSDLINELGAWVLDQALAQLAAWQRMGFVELRMAINVSSRQFWRSDFQQSVMSALDKSGVPPHLVELELTERLAMQDTEKLISSMTDLHRIGVRLSIDDFGTGYSSLMYLKKLPFNVLKIDRSFVTGLPLINDDAVICRTILAMSSALGFETVAEGIETKEQEDFLREHGCQLAQGYLFSKPVDTDKMTALLLQI